MAGSQPDDIEIIRSVVRGDAEAYAVIVRRYQDRVLRLCFSILGGMDAEDAAQEVFLKAYDSLDRFRMEASFSTWLYAIAYRHCLNLLDKRNRRKTESLDALKEKMGERADSLAAEPERSGREDAAAAVRPLLEGLSHDERAILALRELEALSYKEIARTLGISVDAVKIRLFRARAAFREAARSRNFPRPETV